MAQNRKPAGLALGGSKCRGELVHHVCRHHVADHPARPGLAVNGAILCLAQAPRHLVNQIRCLAVHFDQQFIRQALLVGGLEP